MSYKCTEVFFIVHWFQVGILFVFQSISQRNCLQVLTCTYLCCELYNLICRNPRGNIVRHTYIHVEGNLKNTTIVGPIFQNDFYHQLFWMLNMENLQKQPRLFFRSYLKLSSYVYCTVGRKFQILAVINFFLEVGKHKQPDLAEIARIHYDKCIRINSLHR